MCGECADAGKWCRCGVSDVGMGCRGAEGGDCCGCGVSGAGV